MRSVGQKFVVVGGLIGMVLSGSEPAVAGVLCTGNCYGDPTIVEVGSYDYGNGILQIDAGSHVGTGGWTYIGSYNPNTNSTGSVTVTGAGSQLNSGGATGSTLGVGTNIGIGTLTIADGALVTNSSGTSGTYVDALVGIGWGGTGTVNVTSGGSLIDQDLAGVGGNDGIVIGASQNAAQGNAGPGNGALNVSGSGSLVNVVSANTDIAAYIQVGATGTFYTGTDSATGALNVTGGGEVVIDGGTGTAVLSAGTGGVGQINVSGIGSEILVTGGLPGIAIGNDFNGANNGGVGTLTISNSGQVRIVPGPVNTVSTPVGVLNIPDSSYAAIGLGGGSGLVTVQTGGELYVDGNLFVSLNDPGNGHSEQSGTLVVNNTGSVTVTGTTYVGNGTSSDINGILAGTGTMNSDVVVQTGGLIGPGNSPGTLTINGDLTVDGGLMEIEIAGLGLGQFDRLVVSGVVDLTNANVLFSFIDGFLPTTDDIVEFITADIIEGLGSAHFTYQGAAPGFELEVVQGANGLQFLALNNATKVPEPGTLSLFGAGLLGLVLLRRRAA